MEFTACEIIYDQQLRTSPSHNITNSFILKNILHKQFIKFNYFLHFFLFRSGPHP